MDTMLNDPRGTTITLTDACWHLHILKRHPIMQGLLHETEVTITAPDFIFASKIDPNVHLYYKQFTHEQWGQYYLMVVIDISTLLVKTAFPVYNLNKGKAQLWP